MLGLKDGDRIVELGEWKLGMSYSLLSKEWDKMHSEKLQISVLRPVSSTYEKLSKIIDSAKFGCEEYHIYALTFPELNMLNDYTNKQNAL